VDFVADTEADFDPDEVDLLADTEADFDPDN